MKYNDIKTDEDAKEYFGKKFECTHGIALDKICKKCYPKFEDWANK